MPIYLRCSILIQKQVSKNILFFAGIIIFSVLMFQTSTRILLFKIKNP